MARIKPPAWRRLDVALEKLGGTTQPGLYHVDVPPDMVRNSC
jgi:hypothetical protein